MGLVQQHARERAVHDVSRIVNVCNLKLRCVARMNDLRTAEPETAATRRERPRGSGRAPGLHDDLDIARAAREAALGDDHSHHENATGVSGVPGLSAAPSR
jgi:hypothetical protein